jgi:hypothetical protein
MKSKSNPFLFHTLLASITAALAGTPAMAATSISSGFAGPALDAGLENTFTASETWPATSSNTTLTLSNTAAFTGGDIANRRSYVGTVGADYATSPTNWTATIEVTTTGIGDSGQLFFGLGTGKSATNTNNSPWGTPQGATAGEAAAFILMYEPTNARSLTTIRKPSNQGYWAGQTDINDATFDTIVGTTGGVAANSHYRYTMAYDALAQTLTFDVDQISGFGGTVTSSGSANAAVMSLTGMGYNSTNGKIFFGGYNSTFDNLNVTVVPEPSAALLSGLGMLCLLRRRR